MWSLTALRTLYRPSVVLRACKDWGDWTGLAHMHTMLGNFAMALRYRLHALREYLQRGLVNTPAAHSDDTVLLAIDVVATYLDLAGSEGALAPSDHYIIRETLVRANPKQ